jgi:LytR cell envelope-related transcriptional attenuator
VVVLNATEATGLAHKLASNLRQSGYTQAQASSANPPSALSTSVVQYTSGHRTEARHVAQTLAIGEVTPMEGAIASAVNGASVVVIAGADKASLVGAATEAAPGEAEAAGGEG